MSDYGMILRNDSEEIIINSQHMNYALAESGTFIDGSSNNQDTGAEHRFWSGGADGTENGEPTDPDPLPTLTYSVTYAHNYTHAPLIAVELMQSLGQHSWRGYSITSSTGPICFYGHIKSGSSYTGFQVAKTALNHKLGLRFNYMVFVPADDVTPPAGEHYGVIVKNADDKVCYDSRLQYLKIKDFVQFEFDDFCWSEATDGYIATWSIADNLAHGRHIAEGYRDLWNDDFEDWYYFEDTYWNHWSGGQVPTNAPYGIVGNLENWDLKTWKTHDYVVRPFYIVNNTSVATLGTYFGSRISDSETNWYQNALFKNDGPLFTTGGEHWASDYYGNNSYGQPMAPKGTHVAMTWVSVIEHRPKGYLSVLAGGRGMPHPVDVVVIEGDNYFNIPDYVELAD